MIIYHGTPLKNMKLILKEGIKPRGKKKGNWGHSVPSNPKAVYLTKSYGLHFAAASGLWPVSIIELNLDDLDDKLLAPDEDCLEQGTRNLSAFDFLESKSMRERTLYFRQRAFTKYRNLYQESLKMLGTCCYYGVIPPKAIKRYAIIEQTASIRSLSDPTITIANYRLLGDFYINLTHRIFDDPFIEGEITPVSDCYTQFSLSEASRIGITVVNMEQ